MVEEVLAWLGLTKSAAVGGFFGAIVSLKFIDGNVWQRFCTAGAGWMCAAVLAPAVIEKAALTMAPRNELAVAFVLALFGMSITAQILKALPEWATALKERIFGGGR